MSKKYSGLELCRFLAALAVVVCHYQFFFARGLWVDNLISLAERASLPLYQVLYPLYDRGYLAVQVFWVISGFIFFWKYSGAVHDRSIDASTFGVWRLSRLYPLHFATLVAVALMQPLYQLGHGEPFISGPNNASNFVLHLAMASNWFSMPPTTFNVPIWSVSAEILVYLAFFLVVRKVRPGIILCACIVIAANQIGRNIPVVECLQFFFAGGLVQRLLERVDAKHQMIAFWGAVCVAAAVLVCVHFGIAIGRTLLLFLSTGIIAAFSLLDRVVKWDLRSLSKLGDLTYASYLLHFPLQLAIVLVVDACGVSRAIFLSPFSFVLFVAGTFLLSAVVYRYFERPAQNMIRSLRVSGLRRPPESLRATPR